MGEERVRLREHTDTVLIVEYIRTSIEILLQLKNEQHANESEQTMEQREFKTLFKGGKKTSHRGAMLDDSPHTLKLFQSLGDHTHQNWSSHQ